MDTNKKIFAVLLMLLIGFTSLTACANLQSITSFATNYGMSGEVASPADQSGTSQPQDNIELSYPIVDTGQLQCYDDQAEIACPSEGELFFGQDAQYRGNPASYTDNSDGTVTDHVTGLMWQQDPGEKMTYQEALDGVESFALAGYTDWRLPTIKELYSLIQFYGLDPSVNDTAGLIPFIDTDYFNFEYGDTSAGDRIIDSQWATSSVYSGTVFVNQRAMFGVNFADGRIKGYPIDTEKEFFVIYVRGSSDYGLNDFVDNGDGTISDLATGLTWMQNDSGIGMDWESALNFCETLDLGGSNWRLPNAKELQSIVDYGSSPDSTNSAAIDPVFSISTITNEVGQLDYPYLWSSTTHASLRGGSQAVYLSFGRAMGFMREAWIDVHGAGAQRSDPKSGDPAEYASGRGPQGDAVHILNYVRCVSNENTFNPTSGEGTAQFGETSPSIRPQPQAGFSSQASQGDSPPQEAVDACKDLEEWSACSISTPTGRLDGSCFQIEDILACVPVDGSGEPPPDP